MAMTQHIYFQDQGPSLPCRFYDGSQPPQAPRTGQCSLGLPEGSHRVALRYELETMGYEIRKKMRSSLVSVDSYSNVVRRSFDGFGSRCQYQHAVPEDSRLQSDVEPCTNKGTSCAHEEVSQRK
jgi:hypothetical protein